jgi:DNA-binding transcriptional regulator YiaG
MKLCIAMHLTYRQNRMPGRSEDNPALAAAKKTLGARIRLLREQHGLSKMQLARASIIHRIYLG